MPAVQYPQIAPATLTGADAIYYTVGEFTPATLCLKCEVWLCNTSTSSIAVTLNAVPSGGSSAAANQIFADTLLPKKSRGFTIFLNLAENGTIRGFASTTAVVSMRLAPAEV